MRELPMSISLTIYLSQMNEKMLGMKKKQLNQGQEEWSKEIFFEI